MTFSNIQFVQYEQEVNKIFYIIFLCFVYNIKIKIKKQMNNNTQMQDEYESQYVQNSFSFQKMINESSQRDQSINFAQLAKLHLRQYDDVDQNQFQFIQQSENIHSNNQNSQVAPKNYLKLHSTIVPIGYMFQADVPDIMPIGSYLKKNKNQLERLKGLKIHDPIQNQTFYKKNKKVIQNNFGQNRTYEQIACIKKCMNLYEPGCTLEKYLQNEKVFKFWDEHFKFKDNQILKKLKKKKKRPKGCMDL